jgi:diguanylate cyclase (GGDEF)-like protein
LALKLAPALAIGAALIGVLAFAGYAMQINWLVRPIPSGPATHPLTALSIAFLGVGAFLALRRRRSYSGLVLAVLVITISLARLSVALTGDWTAFQILTPFPHILAHDAQAGAPVRMGLNTAATLLLAAIALIFWVQRKPKLAQSAAFAATAFPLVALDGYLYGISSFHGQMAPTTIAGTLGAAGGILLSTAHRGMLRGILSPWPAGRIARLQIGILTGAYFLLGFVICRLKLTADLKNFAVETILMSFVIVVVIGYSASVYERLDQSRRQAEQAREQAAMQDFLTGLRNRRSFFAEAEKFWSADESRATPISVLVIDIDHFKTINDRFGHDAGDAILRWIGSDLPRKVGSFGVIARMGGEEFVALLPGVDLRKAKQLAETICTRVAEADMSSIVSGLDQITASIGIAAGSRTTHGLRELLAAADAALYRAKAAGRNRAEA